MRYKRYLKKTVGCVAPTLLTAALSYFIGVGYGRENRKV